MEAFSITSSSKNKSSEQIKLAVVIYRHCRNLAIVTYRHCRKLTGLFAITQASYRHKPNNCNQNNNSKHKNYLSSHATILALRKFIANKIFFLF